MENLIYDGASVECTRRFLALVREAAERANYFGNWALAFGATGLRGMRAHGIDGANYYSPEAALEVDDYAESTGATYAELTDAPGTLTRRLVGPLLRALATEDRYPPATPQPPPPRRKAGHQPKPPARAMHARLSRERQAGAHP